MKNFFAVLMVFAVSACAGQQLPEAGTADVAVYKKRCTVCHSWPHPERHTKEEWDHYLPLMEAHMKNKGIVFPPEDKKIIRGYLHRNAR